VKRSPINRSSPDKIRAWQNKSRKPLPPVSTSRAAERGDRDRCRKAVHDRAAGRCEYAAVIPEKPCGFVAGRGMEVDEIRGGSYRSIEHTDPAFCWYTCPMHHDYKTSHKRTIIERLLAEGRITDGFRRA
jgi:hypothetical protein